MLFDSAFRKSRLLSDLPLGPSGHPTQDEYATCLVGQTFDHPRQKAEFIATHDLIFRRDRVRRHLKPVEVGDGFELHDALAPQAVNRGGTGGAKQIGANILNNGGILDADQFGVGFLDDIIDIGRRSAPSQPCAQRRLMRHHASRKPERCFV